MKRGQISTEYIFAIGAILLVFGLISFVVQVHKEINRDLDDAINARSKCMQVASAISEIYILGDGASITIPIPNYNATVTTNGVVEIREIDTNKDLGSCNYLAKVASQVERLNAVLIKNKRGTVYVS